MEVSFKSRSRYILRVYLFGDLESGTFATNLLRLGDGKLPYDSLREISFPFGNIVKTATELAVDVFPQLEMKFRDRDWLAGRAILAPKNDKVAEINHALLDKLPEKSVFSHRLTQLKKIWLYITQLSF